MEFRYAINEKVRVRREWGWINAQVLRFEPYRGQPGYYVIHTDAREMWESHGGWTYEAFMEPVS